MISAILRQSFQYCTIIFYWYSIRIFNIWHFLFIALVIAFIVLYALLLWTPLFRSWSIELHWDLSQSSFFSFILLMRLRTRLYYSVCLVLWCLVDFRLLLLPHCIKILLVIQGFFFYSVFSWNIFCCTCYWLWDLCVCIAIW